MFSFQNFTRSLLWFWAIFVSLNLLKAQVCLPFFYSCCSCSPESQVHGGLVGPQSLLCLLGRCMVVCKVLCVQNLIFSPVTENNCVTFQIPVWLGSVCSVNYRCETYCLKSCFILIYRRLSRLMQLKTYLIFSTQGNPLVNLKKNKQSINLVLVEFKSI